MHGKSYIFRIRKRGIIELSGWLAFLCLSFSSVEVGLRCVSNSATYVRINACMYLRQGERKSGG